MTELNMENDSFTVKDDQAAEWCLKNIHEAQQDKERWKKHYEQQLEKVNAEADNRIAYFTARLEEYFARVPHKATKTTESYSLPGGKLVQKKQQPEYKTDDAELLQWLKENFMFDFIKTKTVESADWAGLKKVVTVTPDGAHVATDDGEIVPGVTVTQRPDVFKVEMEG